MTLESIGNRRKIFMEDNYQENYFPSFVSFIPDFRYIRQMFMAPVLQSGSHYSDVIDDGCAGIWQGRFQVIHNGHYHVFEASLSGFQLKMIAIVDPNPNLEMRPCDYENFLNPDDNPFTFFQRMLLWKLIVDDYNTNHDKKIQVIMFPCWHAQEYLEFEKSEFLPRNRSWIVPFKQSADTSNDPQAKKAYHLHHKMHEKVYRAPLEEEECKTINRGQRTSFDEKPLSELHASRVRALLDKKPEVNPEYLKCVPKCIGELQKNLYLNIRSGQDAFCGVDMNFVAVPFIGNRLDLYSLQKAISEMEKDEKSYIVFVVSVRVKQGKDKWINADPENIPWWFKLADHDVPEHNVNYMTKSKMLTDLMVHLKIDRYLIAPIFVLGNSFSTLSEYNNAFLPPLDKTKWIINKQEKAKNAGGYYQYGFNAYLTNIGATTLMAEEACVSSNLRLFFNEEKYQEFSYESQRKISVDAATRTKLGARISTIKPILLGLVGGNNPPELANNYLSDVEQIEHRLKNGWNSERELQDDKDTLVKIDAWLKGIA